MATSTATRADTYGSGSMKERAPGVWRLRFLTDDGGERKVTERTFRGTQTAARRRLRELLARPRHRSSGTERWVPCSTDTWIKSGPRRRAPDHLGGTADR